MTMKLCGALAVCLLLAAGAPRPAQALDSAPNAFILPGDYAQSTTVADFESRFGKANVTKVEAIEEGRAVRSLVLFPNDPTRRAYVEFHDSVAMEDLRSISVRDAASRWRGKGGAHVGMSVAELQAINGKPFYFSGFDSELRAWSSDRWSPALDGDDGKLGALDVGEGEHMYFGVQLGLRGKDNPADTYPHDDASVSSDDPRYRQLGELGEVIEINATTSLDDEWQ